MRPLLAVIVITGVLFASSATAQVRIAGAAKTAPRHWEQVLDSVPPVPFDTIPTGGPNTSTGRCKLGLIAPDSLALVTPNPKPFASLYGYEPGSFLAWNFLSALPTESDTLRLRVRDIQCDPSGFQFPTLLLETQHRWFGVWLSDIWTNEPERKDTPQQGYIRVVMPGGRLEPAAWSANDSEYVIQSYADYRRVERAAALADTKAATVERRHAAAGHGWPARIVEMIANGKIQEGMTPAMIRIAWGPPERVNTTQVRGRTHEQWVYGSGYYVYLDDGVVTGIQQTH